MKNKKTDEGNAESLRQKGHEQKRNKIRTASYRTPQRIRHWFSVLARSAQATSQPASPVISLRTGNMRFRSTDSALRDMIEAAMAA
ncbi:MAG: hypothetical protein WAK27_21500, partial [Candidatus Sulfotelmatobacter sp.]